MTKLYETKKPQMGLRVCITSHVCYINNFNPAKIPTDFFRLTEGF